MEDLYLEYQKMLKKTSDSVVTIDETLIAVGILIFIHKFLFPMGTLSAAYVIIYLLSATVMGALYIYIGKEFLKGEISIKNLRIMLLIGFVLTLGGILFPLLHISAFSYLSKFSKVQKKLEMYEKQVR